MEILLLFIASYFLYGGFLVWRDFHSTNFVNAPMYVHHPSLKGIIFALIIRPFSANAAHIFLPVPAQKKFFGIIKLLIKVGLIGFILQFIISLF